MISQMLKTIKYLTWMNHFKIKRRIGVGSILLKGRKRRGKRRKKVRRPGKGRKRRGKRRKKEWYISQKKKRKRICLSSEKCFLKLS